MNFYSPIKSGLTKDKVESMPPKLRGLLFNKAKNKDSKDIIDQFNKEQSAEQSLTQYCKQLSNISRAKGKVLEYVSCNDWDYFITFTIDGKKHDRYNLKEYMAHLSKWINNP